jgi:hypothetical protein
VIGTSGDGKTQNPPRRHRRRGELSRGEDRKAITDSTRTALITEKVEGEKATGKSAGATREHAPQESGWSNNFARSEISLILEEERSALRAQNFELRIFEPEFSNQD